jgi:hypothetical protein
MVSMRAWGGGVLGSAGVRAAGQCPRVTATEVESTKEEKEREEGSQWDPPACGVQCHVI